MKRKVFARRAASAALAACMMFTLSAPALAESTDALRQLSTSAKSAVSSVLDVENTMEAPAEQLNLCDGSITVYIGEDGQQYAQQDGGEARQISNLWITTNNSETNYTLTIKGGATAVKVTLENVNINASGAAVSVSGDVELIISGTNTLHSGTNHAGVEKAEANDNGTLTISGTGTLNAYGGESGAGIGSIKDVDVSNIVIESGTINAYGGSTGEGWGAGIGGGNNGDASNITINGGIILAVGGSEAAGIGGGIAADASGITINGGEVTAIGGGGAAAIGGGRAITSGGGKAESIQITGGNVTVKSRSGIYIGGINGETEIDTNKLLGTITKLDKNGNQIGDKIVQDFGIKINNRINVTSENYKDILGNGKLWYDVDNNILKSNGQLNGTVIDAPGVDVDLNGGDNIAVTNNKLIVSNAHDVTVSSDKYAALGEGAEINCTGKVIINALGRFSSYAIGARGQSAGLLVITGATSVEINAPQYDQVVGGWQGVVDITCDGPVTIRGNAETGKKIANSFTYKRTDGKAYVYYTSEGADEGAIDASVTPIPSDVPYSYLRIEEKQNASIKVNNGTVTAGDKTEAQLDSFKGQKVTVTATGTESDDRKFDCWEVVNAPNSLTIDADKLGEKSFDFIMPAGEVELTAYYTSRLSVTGGTARVNGEQTDFARKGAAVTVTADDCGEDYKFDHWELSEDSADIGLTKEQLEEATLNFDMPDGPVKLTAVYSAAVTVVNGTAEAGTESGEKIFVLQGETVTVSGKNRNPDVAKFGGWTVISPEDFELTDEQKNTEESMTFTMPDSPVELKASYSFPAPVMDMPVTVNGGTIRVGEGESQTGTVLVQPGQTITVEANEPAKENESFHHWKIEKDSSKDIGIIEGSLGSETEKGTEKIVFTMPQDGVELTAVYSIPAPVMKNTVTVEGGTAKSTLDEGSNIRAEIGTTVKITATPYDEDDYPGMVFMGWEIVYPDNFPEDVPEELQLKLADPGSTETSFEMPAYPVKLVAQWSASPLDPTQPIDPDEPLDPGFGYDEGSDVGGAIAAVAVGGAAVFGGYEIATRVILHNILPEGASIPANRGELAMLIWTEQGKPEPTAQPAFADVTDAETAKAAQWCVEQGYLNADGDRFDPNGWTPKFRVIEVWSKAFPR